MEKNFALDSHSINLIFILRNVRVKHKNVLLGISLLQRSRITSFHQHKGENIFRKGA